MNSSEALRAQETLPITGGGSNSLVQDFQKIRATTIELCAPLSAEDCMIQTMPDVSPPKWHLAHTTWFFETFLLKKFNPQYQVFHPEFNYLFNSYYKGVGAHYPRAKRGLVSRPSLDEVLAYREQIETEMLKLLQSDLPESTLVQIKALTTLGLHHEQQHQELLLTDLKHILLTQPLCPVYQTSATQLTKTTNDKAPPLTWQNFSEGNYDIGHDNKSDQNVFAFDNESPRHRVWLQSFALSERLITNGEYLAFLQDGAYQNPLLWLSDGWDWVLQNEARAPLYWEQDSKQKEIWWQRSLSGRRHLILAAPVCHLNYFEAEAFARWAGKRLPTEAEWEVAASSISTKKQGLSDNFSDNLIGNFLEAKNFHPLPAATNDATRQLFGDVWEWTSSPYTPYPGFQPAPGAVGEYNGKFMCNQMVLKGGSCFTPQNHLRLSYRNFFPPTSQWQMTGLRLAKNQ